MKLNYLPKPYIVTMGLFHMALLLPFNKNSTLTETELQEVTQLPEQELQKHLRTLIDSKILTTEVRKL